jgi:hypothetical protein
MSTLSPPLTLPAVGSLAVYQTLLSLSAVTDTFGASILNMPFASADVPYPFLLHHAEPGGDGYGMTIGIGHAPESWRGRYVVRLECEGESTDPVLTALYAIQTRFAAGPLVAPSGYFVTAEPLEPWPQILGAGSMEEGGVIYSQTGDFYTLEVLNLGA